AGAALVEQEHAELAHRPAEPARPAVRSARRVAGTALQPEQPGQVVVGAFGRDDLPGIHLDPFTVGVGVVERCLDDVVTQDESGPAVFGYSHGSSRAQRPYSSPSASAASRTAAATASRRLRTSSRGPSTATEPTTPPWA